MENTKIVHDKVVVVTGAGGGIGREIALAMARHGAKVVVNDIGASLSGDALAAKPGQQVVEEIREFAGAQRIIENAVDTYGRIDCVVNNAGILRDRIFHKMSIEDWDAVMKVHLYGCY